MYRAVRTASNLLPPFKDRIREWGIQRFGSEDYRNAGPMRATMAKMLAEDWRTALPRIQASTLLIYGEKDEEVPLAVAHEAMRELPAGARLVVMQDAGHFPFLDDTDRFVDEVTQFLQPAGAAVDG
jgi:pimeloyl-ACP methyl ester carboxylesterase